MATKPASKSVDVKSKTKTNIEKAESASTAEAAKMESLKKQPNVEVSVDSKIVTLGVDEYDRWVKEYFELDAAPGYTPNFSREDFPNLGAGPIMASRCYFNKVDGKHVILDIFTENEHPQSEINLMQATIRARGFHYTWTIQGEETTLEEIFKVRMMAKNGTKAQTVTNRQTNVVMVNG